MPLPIPKKILARQHEITVDFLNAVEKHIGDVLDNKAEVMWEIRDFADHLHIHPTHLSNTIKLVTGKSPCFFVEEKIMIIAKDLLADHSRSINEIATILTFDPSNFTNFLNGLKALRQNITARNCLLIRWHINPF